MERHYSTPEMDKKLATAIQAADWEWLKAWTFLAEVAKDFDEIYWDYEMEDVQKDLIKIVKQLWRLKNEFQDTIAPLEDIVNPKGKILYK